jgi:hypothetical protein
MPNFTTTDPSRRENTFLKRALWFVGLWCAGVVAVGIVALIFHFLLRPG